MRKITLVLLLLAAVTAGADQNMNQTALKTTIGEGPDQQVEKLYENKWTKLVQITLRNGKTLARHTAKEAITIQCVSGEGVLVLGDNTRVPLAPGVIVAVEPEVSHEVESKPAVSILVTRFLPN